MWSLSTEFGSEADLDPDERPSSSRKRSVDITALHAAVPMSNSSSDSDFLRDADDLPFGLELEGLNINESPRAPGSTSPWKPRDASGWASTQGLVGRYAKVLRRLTTYDLAPESGKLVVLDESLPVKTAFAALRENGIKSAPLWSTDLREYVGLISVSDFVDILIEAHSATLRQAAAAGGLAQEAACDAHIKTLLEHTVAHWRGLLKPRIPHLVFVTPEDSVLEASAAMLQHHIHRVAVLDPASHTLMYLLTHSVILNYLLSVLQAQPNLALAVLKRPISELGWMQDSDITQPVRCCTHDTTFIEVLKRFADDQCSAVPLVDNTGRMVSVVTQTDIRGLVNPGVWRSLQQPVGDLLHARYRGKGPNVEARVIHHSDTVEVVMHKLAGKDIYRLFVLDDGARVVGKVTLSRLFRFLLSLK